MVRRSISATARRRYDRPVVGRARVAACGVLIAVAACGGAPAEVVSSPPPPPSAPVAPVATTTAPAREPSAAELRLPPGDKPAYAPAALMQHVRRLTSEAMAGRRSASPQERVAATYVSEQLASDGVAALPGDLRQQTFALPKRTPFGETESVNVFGFVRGGSPSLSRELLVVGAHIDHVGVVEGKLHPGAEDNASGVAVALEIAAALAARPTKLGRSVLFAFFGAEEIGLFGSRAFVKKPPVALRDVVAMVNVDMIGRPLADRAGLALGKKAFGIDSDRSVGVLGTKGRPAMRKIVDDACSALGVRAIAPEDFPKPIASFIEKQAAERGDNWPFERAGIPALFFSSGESDDYHQPTDLPETLVPEIMADRAAIIHRVIEALSAADRSSFGR
jgi:hypothetical protein